MTVAGEEEEEEEEEEAMVALQAITSFGDKLGGNATDNLFDGVTRTRPAGEIDVTMKDGDEPPLEHEMLCGE